MIPNIDKIIDIVHKEDINNIIDAINQLNQAIDKLPDEIKGDINIIINDKTTIMSGATEEEDGKEGLAPQPLKGSRDRYLSADGTYRDIPKDISYFNNDSNYATKDDLPTKISDLINDSNFIDKQEFLTEFSGNLSDIINKTNGWYKWRGTIDGTTGTWIIIKMDTLYTVTNIEDPRIVLNSNDLNTWYSVYGYWHA